MQRDSRDVIGFIEELLAAKGVQRAADHLLDPLQRERIAQSILKMRRKTAYVATVGSQGAGKTSLLNAVLFSSRLLPEGEGVTTSLVCGIHALEGSEPRIEVRLKSCGKRKLPLSASGLREYLDEGLNPQNEKGVTSVDCYVQSDLVTPGTCFVDTPGLGSLMTWQDDQTMAFVREMSLGIYVLRGTPPMTKSEAEHLYGIWKFSPEFIFVQNVWGESPASVQEGLRENLKAIQAVARRHNDSRPIMIVPVNIHAAAEEAHNPQIGANPDSELSRLRALIRSRIGRGGQAGEIGMQSRQIALCLGQGVETGRKRIDACTVESEEELNTFRESLDEVDESIKAAQQKLSEHEKEFRKSCRGIVADSQRELRDNLRNIKQQFTHQVNADGGPPGTEDAFAGEIQSTVSRIHDAFDLRIKDAESDFIHASADEVRAIENAIRAPKTPSTATPDDLSGTRLAELLGSAIGGVGKLTSGAFAVASAGVFASSVIAGSSAIAALSVSAATVPVIGWVVAGGLLAAGALIKRASREHRRDTLRKHFSENEEKIVRDGTRELSEVGTARAETLIKLVREHVKGSIAQQKKTAEDLKTQMSSKAGSRERTVAELQTMLRDLAEAIIQLQRIAGDPVDSGAGTEPRRPAAAAS